MLPVDGPAEGWMWQSCAPRRRGGTGEVDERIWEHGYMVRKSGMNARSSWEWRAGGGRMALVGDKMDWR